MKPVDKNVSPGELKPGAPANALLYADTDGLTIEFRAERASGGFHAARIVDGVPFVAKDFLPSPDPSAKPGASPPPRVREDRFAALITMAPPAPKASAAPTPLPKVTAPPFTDANRYIIVYVNPAGHCDVEGPDLQDGDHVQCTAKTTTVAYGKHGKDVKAGDDSKCDDGLFCGTVTVYYPLLRERLRIQPASRAVQRLVVKAAFGNGTLSKNDLTAETQFDAAYRNDFEHRGWYSLGDAKNSPGASPSPSPSASPASASSKSGGSLDGAGITSRNSAVRFSAAVHAIDTSFLNKHIGTLIAALPKQNSLGYASPSPDPSASPGALPDAWKKDDFDASDLDAFNVVRRPYRTAVTGNYGNEELTPKAIDFAKLSKINYGAKFLWNPLDVRTAFAYYRGYDEIRSGAAVHGEWDLVPGATVGLTHVIANRGSATYEGDDNVFSTRLHSTNTVIGLVTRFGNPEGRPLQLFTRYASAGSGRDELALLSYSDPGSGRVVSDDGATLRLYGSAGYRSVDEGYDPIATTYEQFTGTRAVVGSLGASRTSAKTAVRDPSAILEVTGSRAFDAVQARYMNLTYHGKIQVGKDMFLDAIRTRSDMAASVFAKQSAKYLIRDANGGTQILRNDLWKAELQYFYSATLSVKFGGQWSTAPADCDLKKMSAPCSSKYTRSVTGEVNWTPSAHSLLYASLQPAPTTAAKDASLGTKPAASNALSAKGLLDFCVPVGPIHFQPRFAYDNNTSEGSATFIPGNLFEFGVDVGLVNQTVTTDKSGKPRYLGRLSWKRVYDAKWLPMPQQYRGFGFSIVQVNDSSKDPHDSDRCNAELKKPKPASAASQEEAKAVGLDAARPKP